MRELKFRVWNGFQMVDDVTVGKFGNFYVNPGDKKNGLDPNDSASLTRFTTKYHENTPIMQFTGLKDKNDKEIYEGDIVEYKAHSGYLLSPFKGKVIWNEEQGCWAYQAHMVDRNFAEHDELHSDVLSYLEVIGNIYETPEVLKHNS
jgi:uncharacterized phage protein (TIGR01671 family)